LGRAVPGETGAVDQQENESEVQEKETFSSQKRNRAEREEARLTEGKKWGPDKTKKEEREKKEEKRKSEGNTRRIQGFRMNSQHK